MTARSLDHLVLPTRETGVARARLTAVGFTVAPDGVHPFGTENCCVYLADGAFLEPLAVADPAIAESAARGGNVFVARDRAFRAMRGQEGFSALVLATDDADEDHERLAAAGLSAGGMLTFSRPFSDASGKSGTATFKLAFGAAEHVMDGFFFTCELVGVPAVDRASLERHANGAVRVAEVTLTGDEASALLDAIGGFADAPAAGRVELAGCVVSALDRRAFEAAYGIERADDAPPFAAITFGVPDLRKVETVLAAGGVASHRAGKRLVVPAAPGQGAIFAFEASA